MEKKKFIPLKDRLKAARQHAIAVLKDRGKIVQESDGDRIPVLTLAALLGLTYTNGSPILKGSQDRALIHWSETGFPTYSQPPGKVTNKQQKTSDIRLMKTALAETMKNRRFQHYNKI